jgi:hypothetical protein
MARLRPVRWFFEPLISIDFPMPKIAFLPIIMLWLGVYDVSKISMVANLSGCGKVGILGILAKIYMNQNLVWGRQPKNANTATPALGTLSELGHWHDFPISRRRTVCAVRKPPDPLALVALALFLLDDDTKLVFRADQGPMRYAVRVGGFLDLGLEHLTRSQQQVCQKLLRLITGTG